MTTMPGHEVKTWSEIHDGDRVALPDGDAGYVVMDVARQGRLASIRPAAGGAWASPVEPAGDAPAARTMRGPVTLAMDTLRAGGLDVEVIDL
jgi:hypothetical protein